MHRLLCTAYTESMVDQQTPAVSFDVAVIGAGLLGAAAAWRLSKRGYSVLTLEKSSPAHRWGSSHGSARIIRYAYFNERYTRMARDSRFLWEQLEQDSGQTLITPTTCLDFGPTAGVSELHAVLKNLGVPSQVLPHQNIQENYPGIAADTPVLYQPTAGVLDAETATGTMLEAAQSNGATLKLGWTVEAVERTGQGFTITSEDGQQISAQQVVVAAGAWFPLLLEKLPLTPAFRSALPKLTVWREEAFHFPYRDQDFAQYWPSTIHRNYDQQIYSLPGGRDANYQGQKISCFLGGTIINSAQEQSGQIRQSSRRTMIDYVRTYFPGLVPEPYAETTCLFTSTPSEDFVIDQEEGLTVVSACSGHGAKTAPMTGEYVAQLVSGQNIPDFLRPTRAPPTRAKEIHEVSPSLISPVRSHHPVCGKSFAT